MKVTHCAGNLHNTWKETCTTRHGSRFVKSNLLNPTAVYSGSCELEAVQDSAVSAPQATPSRPESGPETMSEEMSIQNCYERLSLAKRQQSAEMQEKIYTFMSENFLQVLRDSSVFGRLTGAERELLLGLRSRGKETLMMAETGDAFERVGSGTSSRPQSPASTASCDEDCVIYYYSQSSKDWKYLTKMPDEVNTKGCGMCTMYNYLFVAGGIRGHGDKSKVSDKVFCYDPITDTWNSVRPLNQARSQLKLVAMDGYIYAIGGECLFTVERYDPRTDRWSQVAPLPKGAFAVAHEAASCNGELYVSGGTLFYRLLKYDPRRDEWEECPYNSSRRRSADMVALKNFIYRFDVNRERGISVFKYNTVVKTWHQAASFPHTNPGPFRCAVVGGHVFCVNRHHILQFMVEEDNEHFNEETLKAPPEAKGALYPFTLHLLDRD